MSKATILIVEDQRALWEPLQAALEARDYSVYWVTSATEAMLSLRARNFEFDIIVLDLMVPLHNVGEDSEFPKGGDGRRGGLILLEKMRAETDAEIPVVVMTVVTDPELRKEAGGYAHEVFTKPITLVGLLAAIDRILQSHQIYRHLKGKQSP